MHRFLKASLILIPVALVLVCAPRVAAYVQGSNKVIYATWLDKNGKILTDMKPDEIAVFEDGMSGQRQIVSMKPASEPLSIILLADSSAAVGGGGIGQTSKSAAATSAGDVITDIRAAFSAFAKQMLTANPKSEVALMEFGQASIMMVPFTSNADDIAKGLTRLVVKPDADSVLLEGIMESSKELGKRPNMRRVVVAVNVLPDSEKSAEPANNIMKQVAKDGATFFSASLQKGDLKNSVRGPMLDGFAERTGGRHDTIAGQSALTGVLKNFGDIINAQYEITFVRPTPAPPQAIQLATAPPRGQVKILSTKFPPK